MTISIWHANGEQEKREVDVLIIGAGLVGSAAAYFLHQAGRDVVVTDMRDAGMGASGRNAGFMITGLDTYYHHAIDRYGAEVTQEVWKLSEKTHAYWRGFAREGNVPIDECGSLLLAESEYEASDLEEATRALHSAGIGVQFHTSDPLKRGYYAAIEQPWDAAVHPFKLVQSVLTQSEAEFIPNNEYFAFEQTGPEKITVYTQKYIFTARKLLFCTNAYSPRILPYFIGKIIPTRAQCLITEPLETPLINTCGYSDYGYMYYRMTFDNRLLIGGGRKQHKALENDTTEDRTTDPVQDVLEAYLRQRFPEAVEGKDQPVARRWAGIMGFTKDGLPLVGKLPGCDDVGFAVGFTGHGLALGAGTAERAVDLLLNGTHPGAVSSARLD